MAVNDRSVGRTKRSGETDEGQWSDWYNSDHPSIGEGDFETTDHIEKTRTICPWDREVSRAQCREVGTNHTFDSSTSAFLGDRLLQACSSHGLICLNSQQTSGACRDYEVRFLCQATESEDTDEWLFPNLDFKIYILLAAVPLVVIVLRVLWSCWCKPRFRRSTRSGGEGGGGGGHRGSLSSGGTLSTSSSQASINSALANPPPAYTDLFGDHHRHHHQPAVFSISSGECAGCGKCLHHMAAVTATITPGASGASGQRDGASSPLITPPASPADEVFVTPPTSRTTSAVVLSNNNNNSSNSNNSGSSSEGREESTDRMSSSSALQGATASPLPPPLSSHSSLPTLTSSSSTTPPSRCMCSCHRLPPLPPAAASGHVNLAFSWDSVGDGADPSSLSLRPPPPSHPPHLASPPPPPVLYPGMHKPVFPRIGSATSFTSYTSLPDYEEALEMLQKNGLFKDGGGDEEEEGEEGKK